MSSQRHPAQFPLPTTRGDLPIVDSHLFDDLLPPEAAFELTAGLRHHLEPYVGITENGTTRPGLYRLNDSGASPNSAVAAAQAYLGGLAPHQRVVAALPMDAPEWRLWTNAIPTWHPKGMRLDRLAERDRDRALAVAEASLSPAGYAQVRTVMALNENLGELIDDYRDTLTEFAYWFTVFGTPSRDSPWGWQLMGHHLDLHCVFIGGQVVLAPVFLGAEPTTGTGRFEGIDAFRDETEVAMAFRRTLDANREDDNHPGIFLANPEPARFHVHTIVRAPNGNDYGRDLLAQHYQLHHREHGDG